MIHIDRGGDLVTNRWFFDNLNEQKVVFDAIGQSYYPFWHGMPEDLNESLSGLAACYDKDLYVVETAYPWKHHDVYRSLSNGDNEMWKRLITEYPLSPEGQLRFIQDVVEIVKGLRHKRGKVFFTGLRSGSPLRRRASKMKTMRIPVGRVLFLMMPAMHCQRFRLFVGNRRSRDSINAGGLLTFVQIRLKRQRGS